MGTEKRERQKANRQQRLEEERKAEQRAGAKQRIILAVVMAGLFLGALYLYSVFATNDDDTDTTSTETTVAETTGDEGETDEGATDEGEPDEEEAATAPPCPEADGSSPATTEFAAAPEMCIDVANTYQAVLTTNRGDVTIDLDAERAPATVNNFVFLARYRYYEGVSFHRIIPDFMIQGGDAVGEPAGTGGPGYAFNDELPEAGEYQIGSVAMANSGPDTNGSQFFIVTGENGVALSPDYALFGQVSDGMDVVTEIEATGSTSGTPSEDTIIESVTIIES